MSWIGTLGPDQGMARVFVDGAERAKVDQFSEERRFMVELFSTDGLACGPHRIRIEVDGTSNGRSKGERIDIDAFDVRRRRLPVGEAPSGRQ